MNGSLVSKQVRKHLNARLPIRNARHAWGVLFLFLLVLATVAWPQENTGTPHKSDTVVFLPNGIRAPRTISDPEPEYSEEARKANYQGVAVLSLIVGTDGKPRDVKVVAPLGLGLDEKAVEAIQQWKFEPAMKGSTPVAVQIMVEVQFHLLGSDIGKVEVVSDTKGVNFDSYLDPVIREIESRWKAPNASQPAKMEQATATFQFAIRRDGHIGGLEIVSSSGSQLLERSARDGIIAAAPFKLLPSEFKGKEIVLRMQFLANEQAITIWPNRANVTTGEAKQLYAEMQGVVDPTASWSISGPGCAGSACGSISADGVYTAPTAVPDPPFVRVTATLAGAHHVGSTVLVSISKAK